MSSLIEQFGFEKKTHVGISLSANNFIELICIDKSTKSVVKYASGNIKYNNAIREIIDYDEFTEVLEGLFEEAGLDPQQCAVTLNLPNVHFGITQMENDSEENYIIENLQSEIEDLYIFKRNEPIISHAKFENKKGHGQKNIIFSAIQAKVIVKLLEIFESMQCKIVRIDSSYSSLLKAIQFCDRFNKYVQKEEKTSILLITPNSCCMFYLEGNIIFDIFEEPLAVKSFSTEEVYSTISKIADNTISKNNPQTLLIISETDEVNSELLSSRLNFKGEIDCINKSINVNDQFIEVSGIGSDIDANMISYMTIEAVGAAAADFDEYPLDINFLPPDRINSNIVEVGAYEVDFQRLVFVLVLISVILGLIFGGIIKGFLEKTNEDLSGNSSLSKKNIEVFKKRIKNSESQQTKNIFPVLKQILDTNNSIINVYNALGTEIPDSVYIRKFVANSDGGIGMIGEATTSEQVTVFLKGLKEKKSDLVLYKLSVNTKDDIIPGKIPNGFTFEIKTSNTDIFLNEDEYAALNAQNGAGLPPNISNTQIKTTQPRSNNIRRSGSRSSVAPPPPVI